MEKELVLAGGGHAHLTTLTKINDIVDAGHKVTLINPDRYQYYSGMGPGMLSGIYRPEEIRFNVKKLAEDRGAAFMEDAVVKVDPEKKILFLRSGAEKKYDVLSCNTGSGISKRFADMAGGNVTNVKPIINLLKARSMLLTEMKKRELNIAVIGGGAAGVEITGNLWKLFNDNDRRAGITVIAGSRLLKNFPERARNIVMKSFSGRNIDIAEGVHLSKIEEGKIILTDGRVVSADIIFMATGVTPSPLFHDSGLPTGPDGGLLVNQYLQCTAYPDIFGGGDCISLEGQNLQKVGVYAVRENPVLYHNMLSALSGGEMIPFDPGGPFLLILNLGDGKGLFWKKNILWHGRTSFLLKDYIDRKFMHKFQLSKELEDKEL